MAATSFQVEYKPTPILAKIAERLNDKGRHALEKAGARAASVSVQKWLRALAQTRHATARALGATPTQIIGRTASGVKAEARDGAAVVVVPHPLFRRAFQDVAIAPQKAEALAIPVLKAAYGKSPRSFGNDHFFVWKKDKKGGGKGAAFLARSEGKRPAKLVLYYLLYRGTITQKQDETLLPPMEETAEAARTGVAEALQTILKAAASGKE